MSHDAAAVPEPARGQTLGSFVQTFHSSVCPVDYRCYGDEYDTPSHFRHASVGGVDIFEYKGPSFRTATHRPHHIRANPADAFLLFQPLIVPFEITQSGKSAVVEPGYMTVSTTLQPFETSNRVDPKRNYMEQRVIRIPGAMLRGCVPWLDNCCATPIATERGAGGILDAMIEAVLTQGHALSNAQRDLFGSMLVNTMGVALLDTAACHVATARDETDARLRIKAAAVADAHLSHPQLSPRMIAEQCHVSLRRLHAAFEVSSTTVAAMVREKRLQRCRTELRDPAFARQAIFQIAMRWGFGSPENFSRAYRAHFGISPGEERGLHKSASAH